MMPALEIERNRSLGLSIVMVCVLLVYIADRFSKRSTLYLKSTQLKVLQEFEAIVPDDDFSPFSCAEMNNFPGTVILGRPTANQISFSISSPLLLSRVRIAVEPAESKDGNPVLSQIFTLEPEHPKIITVSSLSQDIRYYYTIIHEPENRIVTCSTTHTFHTQRALGSTFNFAIIADSHLGTEHHCDVARYTQTLSNINDELPDFILSIGDDFRASKLVNPVFLDVEALYRNQRPYFSIVAQDAALYNIVGNHELQAGWMLDGTEHNVAIWAVKSRLGHYANPRPNNFYSGASTMHPFIPYGLLENYYSWTWGDALFVALDDYFYSQGEIPDWSVSLGFEQFNWLRQVIATEIGFKFVFHHHVNGAARGGIELVDQYEWGGWTGSKGPADWKERTEFELYRPGWGGKPVHQILVENGVDIVFQGHDHLYVKQDHPDGIIYLTVPMPGYKPDDFWGGANDNSYAYTSGGVIMGPSGHVTVEVSASSATVSYIRSKIPGDDSKNGLNGEVAHSFIISRKRSEMGNEY